MEQKSGRKKLENLPASGDEFWEHAETHTAEISRKPGCEHNFVYRKANEVRCRACGAGFFLTPGWTVKEGHIYKEGKKVL